MRSTDGLGNRFHFCDWWSYSLTHFCQADFPAEKKWSQPCGFCRALDRLYTKIVAAFDRERHGIASRSYLIELSFRNMRAKRTRTVVTICGMAISIAFIVLLMSMGYGLQNLVTSRVARLEELQQAEVMPGLSDELALNDEVIGRLRSMPQVKSVLPLISVVGRVSYQDSITDLGSYGTTTEYLTTSLSNRAAAVFESHDMARVRESQELSSVREHAGDAFPTRSS